MGSQKHDPVPCISGLRSLRPSFVHLLARCRFVPSLSRIPAPMRGYPPGTHELPGAVAARPLDHFSEVPFAPWCFVPLLSVSFLLSSCCPSSLSVFVRRTRPWRASSSCGLRRRASGVAGGGFLHAGCATSSRRGALTWRSANAGAFGLRRHRATAIPHPHLFQETPLSVFVRRTRPWRASSSCGLRRRASGVAGGGFRGPSSGRRVDFEQALGPWYAAGR